MGIFDDYINDLDGQENIDPVKVAQELSELHKQEITSVVQTHVAKVETVKKDLAAKDQELKKAIDETTRFKAMNFDLSLQVPGEQSLPETRPEGDKPDGSNIRINDLFNPNVRKRHNA